MSYLGNTGRIKLPPPLTEVSGSSLGMEQFPSNDSYTNLDKLAQWVVITKAKTRKVRHTIVSSLKCRSNQQIETYKHTHKIDDPSCPSLQCDSNHNTFLSNSN